MRYIVLFFLISGIFLICLIGGCSANKAITTKVKAYDNSDLIKVFVSKEDMAPEYLERDELIYSELKKLAKPFIISNNAEDFDFKLIPKIKD